MLWFLIDCWYLYYISFFSCFFVFFFFNDTATTEIYTLSLHDALPLSREVPRQHLADGVDQLVLRDGELRLGLLLQIGLAVVLGDCGELGTDLEVLDLDLAFGLLARSLDDRAEGAAA